MSRNFHSESKVSTLLDLCTKECVEDVQRLLEEEGLSVNCCNDEDVTPLHVASANGHELLVQYLLKSGAIVDHPNAYGWTALMQAARHGHKPVVLLLLQYGANANFINKYGSSVLVCAAASGHMGTVQAILNAGAELSHSCDQQEVSPVMFAAQNGFNSILHLFFDWSADINQASASTGITPLMLAAVNGCTTTVQLLVAHGCDVNKINACGLTALEMSKACNHRSVKRHLTPITVLSTPVDKRVPEIIEAVKNGNIQEVRQILSKDISTRNACSKDGGMTPLMFASSVGRIDLAQLLVEYGADINMQDARNGWTALMHAVHNGKKAVAMYLLQAGADVKVRAGDGCTAFDICSLSEETDGEMIRKLANLTFQDDFDLSVQSIMNDSVKKTGVKNFLGGCIPKSLRSLGTKRKEHSATVGITNQSPSPLFHSPRLVVPSDMFHSKAPSFGTKDDEKAINAFTYRTPSPVLRSNLIKPITSPLLHYSLSNKCKNYVMPPGRKTPENGGQLNSPVAQLFTKHSSPLSEFTSLNSRIDVDRKSNNSSMYLLPPSNAKVALPAQKSNSPVHEEYKNIYLPVPKFSSVLGLLESLGLQEFYPRFVEQEVDMTVLHSLTDEDLQSFGMTDKESRERLMQAVKSCMPMDWQNFFT